MTAVLPDRVIAWINYAAEDECWLWSGPTAPQGYGRLSIDGTTIGAHRLVYTALVGPIPDGLQLDHLCRVRNCVNPAHLEPVTRSENMRRAPRNQVTHCPRGHEYTPANLTKNKSGKRACLICNRLRRRRWPLGLSAKSGAETRLARREAAHAAGELCDQWNCRRCRHGGKERRQG